MGRLGLIEKRFASPLLGRSRNFFSLRRGQSVLVRITLMVNRRCTPTVAVRIGVRCSLRLFVDSWELVNGLLLGSGLSLKLIRRSIPVLRDRGKSHRGIGSRLLNDPYGTALVTSVRASLTIIHKHIGDRHIGVKVVRLVGIVQKLLDLQGPKSSYLLAKREWGRESAFHSLRIRSELSPFCVDHAGEPA